MLTEPATARQRLPPATLVNMPRTLAALFVACLPSLLAAQQRESAPPSAIERAEQLLPQGKIDPAIEVLRAAIGTGRVALDERTFLARVLGWLGRSDEAAELLRKGIGLGNADDDTRLYRDLGDLYRRLGDDGPFFRREGGHVAYLPKDDKIDERAWRNEHYRKALDAYLAVLKQRPGSERTYELVGQMQDALELHEAALATWQAAQQRFPKSGAAALGCARALAGLGRADEAAAACEKALQLSPRLAAAHAMLAEHYAKAGKAEEAKRARQQARFYEWAPDFVELDYAAARESFEHLAPQFDEKPADEVLARAREQRKAEIERLLSTRDATSSRLLAVLAFLHEDHGAIEERLYAELEARGAESIVLLRHLLENAQSTCTQKGAARALARLRAPGILETLLEMLPGDVRPLWDADIAGALAELGDRAAVAPLVEVARVGTPDEAGGEGEEYMDRQGREDARLRAVMALGVLGGDAARTALESGTGHSLLGAGCLAALYRLSRDESLVVKVRAAVLAASSLQQLRLIRYLEGFAPELAKELQAARENEKQKEQEKAKESEKGK